MRTSRLQSVALLLGTGFLWIAIPGFGFAQQTQSQQPQQQPTQQQKSKSTAKQPAKASDADKLSDERMSTRGLKRPPKKDQSGTAAKPDDQSGSKPDQSSVAKPDAQK